MAGTVAGRRRSGIAAWGAAGTGRRGGRGSAGGAALRRRALPRGPRRAPGRQIEAGLAQREAQTSFERAEVAARRGAQQRGLGAGGEFPVPVAGLPPALHRPQGVGEAGAERGVPSAVAAAVAEIVKTLRRTAERCSASDVLVALDDVLGAATDLGPYHGVLAEWPMSLGTGPINEGFDAAMLHNLLGFVDTEVAGHTFLTVFDAAIRARVDTRGYLTIDVGRRNIRDCVWGRSREAVRAQGRVLYGWAAAGYGDDWFAIDSLNELVGAGGQRS